MTEQELRQLVRGVIAEREVRLKPDATNAGLPGPEPAWRPASEAPEAAWRPASEGPEAAWRPASAGPAAAVRRHASHALFVIPAHGDACLIEPAVTCNHCGYCKSYGH